jgi:hypothetical protein
LNLPPYQSVTTARHPRRIDRTDRIGYFVYQKRRWQRAMAFRKAARLAAGKTWSPRPHTPDKLVKDFSVERALAFGPDETRQLADMRRSGAVEGNMSDYTKRGKR